MIRRLTMALVTAWLAMAGALVAANLVLRPWSAGLALLGAVCLSFAVTGSILVLRQSRHPVGWLLLMPTVFLVPELGFELVDDLLPETLVPWAAWAVQVSWAVGFLPILVLLPLLFPTGRPPSRGWRWVVWAGIGAVVLLAVGNALSPALIEPDENPAAIGPPMLAEVLLLPGLVLLVVAFVAAVVSVVVRFRRAIGVERQQLRWFRLGAMATLMAWVAASILDSLGRQEIGGNVLGASMGVLPITVLVAIRRHRLYEIDRIVNKTVSYAVLTAILVGVYALGVLGVGALLPHDSDLLVAGSTLAVAALFQPLRSRIQTVVDRRFNRARYDAARTVQTFASLLRDEVDGVAIIDNLQRTVRATFEPRRVSTWQRDSG